jgi:hypothetical protein
MAWIYFQAEADYQKPLRSGLSPSHIVKSTDSRSRCCCPEWQRASCPAHLSGTTSQPLREIHGGGRQCLTLSSEDSPARISALQGLERAWTESEADYFTKPYDYVANFDRDSFSWKTSQLSLFEDSTALLWSSLRWGMIVAGRLYQPQKLAPRTCESDGSLLPTPTTQDVSGRVNFVLTESGRRQCNNGQTHSISLASMVALGLLPTPAARDWKDGLTPRPHGRHSDSVAVAVAVEKTGHQGYLNPQFIEAIMGWPTEATACASWATEWFRSKRAKLLKD